jgi:HEAT repeat protein
MQSTLAALCLGSLAVAATGCGGVPAHKNPDGASDPIEGVQRPVAIVAPPDVPLGEDVNGKTVNAAVIDSIRTALKDPDPTVRRAAIKDLAAVRWKLPESVGGILAIALGDADPDVRIEATRLAATDPLRSAEVARLLHDKDGRVRLTAAQALVGMGKHEQAAYPVLIAVLHDPEASDRPAVLELIRSKAPASDQAAPALIAMSLDAGDPLRAQAIEVLGYLSAAQGPVDALLLTAHDAEPKARAAALRALSRLDPASAKVQIALVKALRESNVELKLAAAHGVGKDGVPILIDLLRQGDERLRDASARALGRIGPDAWAAGAELQRLAQIDPAERVRNTARAAVKAIVLVDEPKGSDLR